MKGNCSHERLELALAGLLNPDDESTITLHLDECNVCAAEMERLAGGELATREIAEMLVPDDLDDALPSREECSAADFVVDHLEPSDDSAALGRLGAYDVLDIIGRGGMGVVLKGFDRELKRFVAIKALAPHLAHSALARKRFAREAQAAAAVVNPHVIAIHQVQPSGQLPFLVMPLLTGESLAQRLTARGTLELTEILRIGMQAAEGLAAAHGQGIIHRDVKPANILLEKGVERAVLTDFGLARAADDVSMTRWGIIAGTPEYMSPEQARGGPLEGRSDLFSLGCVLYETATGVSPFRADSTMATLRRIVDEQPAAMASLAPELPSWFSHIVERLLSKDPTQRFTSADELSQLLEQCLSHLQQPASVPLPASLVPHATRRRSMFNVTRKGVFAMLGTIGLILLGMVLWQATEAPDISGQWTSEEWGTVILEAKQPGQYEGTFTGSGKDKQAIDAPDVKFSDFGTVTLDSKSGFVSGSGTLSLKWSRVERRFNGAWGKGIGRSGAMSLRLVAKEIRGGWTTDEGAQLESGTPLLGDLLWTRNVATVPDGGTVLLGSQKTSEAAKSATKSAEPKTVVQSSNETRIAQPDWVVAWDFRYTLLNHRYAMMRISSDGNMEAHFPGWRLLRTQLSPDELSALVTLVANHPKVQSRSIGKVAAYSQAVSTNPELVDSIKKVNVRSEVVAVVNQGEFLELDLDASETIEVTNQLWKLVGLAAIGGSEKLPNLVDAANRELKRKYPHVSHALDRTHFRFAIVDHPSGNVSAWFKFNIDPGSKDGQVVLRIPEDGQPSIEQVVTPKGESPPVGAERPTEKPFSTATPNLPKLPDEGYTRTGIHCQNFREQDAKRPGGERMGDVVEPKRGNRGRYPLLLGMRIASDSKWNMGGQARVELVVRNAGGSDVKFSQTPRSDNGLSVVAIDNDGKEHPATIVQFDSWLVMNRLLLPPSHMVMVKAFTLRFDPEKLDVSDPGVAAFQLPPGDYTLRCKWSDARPEVAHAGEWTGELVSVGHKFTLAALPDPSEK
jgi:serine/threonine protein kinase